MDAQMRDAGCGLHQPVSSIEQRKGTIPNYPVRIAAAARSRLPTVGPFIPASTIEKDQRIKSASPSASLRTYCSRRCCGT